MLDVVDLEVRYGTRVAVDGVSFAVERGDVLSVLGPSGSGKTSLLRAVAGLEVPARGSVSWSGVDVTSVPPHRRLFGFVFQHFALFPHRDVSGNVAFGLRMQGRSRAAIDARVAEVLEMVGLAGFAGRPLTSLSGGELQRVALARALAPEPGLLLLDEPLGSLDRVLRERLTGELSALLAQLDVAAIHVTHDQQEAFALGGRIAVMRDGAFAQLGTAEELWRHPTNAFVARFLGFANVVPVGAARRLIPGCPSIEGDVAVVIPPDAVEVSADGPIEGTVSGVVFRGDHFVASVDVADVGTLDVHVRGRVRPTVGDRVRLQIDADAVSVLPPEP